MRSRPGHLALVILAVALLLGACENGSEDNQPLPPPSQAEGLITEITPAEGEPESFVLETEEHGTFEVFIAEGVDYGFDLQHLHEHMDGDLPVTVQLEERDGRAAALSIDDI